jgi:hypothetical protein
MKKNKKTPKQFEIEIQKWFLEKYDFIQEHIDLLFENKKLHYQSCLELEINFSEKIQFLTTEITRVKEILIIPNVAKLIYNLENHKNKISIEDFESISEESLEIINRSDFARFNEFVNYELDYDSFMDEVTSLDVKKMAFDIIDLLAQKKYYFFLLAEYNLLSSTITTSIYSNFDSIEDPINLIEHVTIDSSLIKWNKKKGDFYFLIDALEEGGFISYTGINKTEGMHQLARCLGIELAKNWQSTRTNLYKEEKIQFDNGKTNLFKELELAFNRMVEKKEIIINAKENNTKEQLAEIKSKKNQE